MATGKESFHARSVPAVPWGRILTLMLCLAVLALATWEYRMRQIGLQADDIAGAQFIYGAPDTPRIPVPAALPLLASGLALFGLVRARARS